MCKKLGVLLIRGAGEAGFKKQEKFVKKLNKQLKELNVKPTDVHYEYADWYGPTQHNQEMLLNMFMRPEYKLKSKRLRKLILYVASDITAYSGVSAKPSNMYWRTHVKIHDSILNIKNNVEKDAPLIIIASSLATEIMSNYIWDRQRNKDTRSFGLSPLEQMKTLTGLFMLGNDTPIYIASQNITDARPFDFPDKDILPEYESVAKCVNFYDRHDPLGFPMKIINRYYDEAYTEDIEVNAGNIFTSWNVGSHFAYWNTKYVNNYIAEHISNVLKLA